MLTVEDRFWAKVIKSDDGCWLWSGAHLFRRNGAQSYGSFHWKGRQTGAHRVMYELMNGPIPDGLQVLHHCDNEGCCRPDHLYAGTHADNIRDRMDRHRQQVGAMVWNHKLTDQDVRRIRALIARGIATERIGPLFGVSGRTIRFIRAGKRWAHVHD